MGPSRWTLYNNQKSNFLQCKLCHVNTIWLYLNEGTGNACAWHKTAQLLFKLVSNQARFVFGGNVGAFVPTGSKIQNYKLFHPFKIQYLNDGTGKAWAWHRIANPFPSIVSTQTFFVIAGNVGALVPTGSTNKYVSYYIYFFKFKYKMVHKYYANFLRLSKINRFFNKLLTNFEFFFT